MKAPSKSALYVGILDGKAKVWGVRIPDVPGCYGAGATPEEAISDVSSALAELLAEGFSLATPRSIKSILADRKIKIDTGRGDTLVLIDAPVPKRRRAREPA